MTTKKYAAQIEVIDIAQRREEITQLARQAKGENKTQPFNDFPGRQVELPLIRIRNTWLVYRMENRRTRVRQLGWIKHHALAPEYFLQGEENDTAQRDQHQLLVDFTERDEGNVKSIYDVLQEERVQREPLLITHDGVVVNGNRRLAAMRELYARHAGATSGQNPFEVFEYVNALVLPQDTDLRTISKIEIKLQMTPETRLPYSWIDEGLALRDMRDNQDMSLDELAKLMKLNSAREVSDLIERVQEAENFLAEYERRPGDYELIIERDLEQHFKTAQQLLAGKRGKSGLEQELARSVSYVIAGNPEAFERKGRTYDYRHAYGDQVKAILQSLRDAYPDEFQQAVQSSDTTPPVAAELDMLFAAPTVDPFHEFAPLKTVLLNREKGQELAATVITTFEELTTRKSGEDRETAAQRDAMRAHTLLTGIHLDTAAPNTYRALQAQLEGAQRRCSELLTELSGRMKATGEA